MYLDEGLPQNFCNDEDIISITGSELAESCHLNFNELEGAADEVWRKIYLKIYKKLKILIKNYSLI